MVFGMSLATYTLLHVVISLIAIGTGLVVLFGMLNSKKLNGWTGAFLATTALTSITGYGFPFEKLLPSHIIGVISLVLLVLSTFAVDGRHLKGAWRSIYVVGALLGLYLNIFVAIIQSFLKIPTLKALAPTQKEPRFQISQLLVLVLFVLLITFPIRRFHPQSTLSAQAAAHYAQAC